MNYLRFVAAAIKNVYAEAKKRGERLELHVLDPDGTVRWVGPEEHAEFIAGRPIEMEGTVGGFTVATTFLGVVLDGQPLMYSTALFDCRNGEFLMSHEHADRPSAFDFHQNVLLELDRRGNK